MVLKIASIEIYFVSINNNLQQLQQLVICAKTHLPANDYIHSVYFLSRDRHK